MPASLKELLLQQIIAMNYCNECKLFRAVFLKYAFQTSGHSCKQQTDTWFVRVGKNFD